MALSIKCPCGWSVRAENKDDLIRQVQQHAKEVHNQTATPEEVMAMAQPS